MKRRIAVIISLISVFCFFILTPVAAEFKDIKGHTAEKEIKNWTDKGVAFGYTKTYFKPNMAITRAQFATMVNKAFGLKKSARVRLSDVSLKNKYVSDIKIAVGSGYMNLFRNGQFRPNNKITRQDAAVMFAKILKLDTSKTDMLNKFKDYKAIAVKNKGAVNAVIAKGYMTEYSDNTFKPNKYLTRAELVVILDRILSDPLVKMDTYEAITEVRANNGTINIKLSGDVTGLTSKDFEVTAKLNGNKYTLENLVFDEKNNSYTFKKLPSTYSDQNLEIIVSGATASKKVVGSKSVLVKIERIYVSTGGYYVAPSTVLVSTITVTGDQNATEVAYGNTLKMNASVMPNNATNKAITWSVETLAGGIATIDSATGILTAKGVGTVTVKATNLASRVTGTKIITIINANQAAPTGLAAEAPTTLGGNDGKITGTSTDMEYKLSSAKDYIAATGTEITGLAAGVYTVRFAAKSGYNAGEVVDIVVPTDNFENGVLDNSYQTAREITTDGTPQSHVIYPSGDEDWVKFCAEAGNIYQIATSNLINDKNNELYCDMDTYVELYNTDGKSLITYNDDYINLQSNIPWHCSISGTYYVRIMHYTHNSNYSYFDDGTGSYNISITKTPAATLDRIEIDKNISKSYYFVGEEPKLFVVGYYTDTNTATTTAAFEIISPENIEGFDSSKAAQKQKVTVTFGGMTTTFEVNILAKIDATPINNGTENPYTVVSLMGDTFTEEAKSTNYWYIYCGTTGLSNPIIELQGEPNIATSVKITFEGTTKPGKIQIQPYGEALTSGVAGSSVKIITATEQELLEAAETAVEELEAAIDDEDLTLEANLIAAENLLESAKGSIEAAVGIDGVTSIRERLIIAERKVREAEATAAVVKAENSKLQNDLYYAKYYVSLLLDGELKTALQGRIDVVQGIIDDAALALVKAAAVEELNAYKTQTDYSQENWNSIIGKKTAGVAAINAAVTAEEVAAALAAAKTEIDDVKVLIAITAIGEIVGNPIYGGELIAGTITPAEATVTYQWIVANSVDGSYENIDGETTNKYTINASDIGKYIKVSATGIENYVGTVTSSAINVTEFNIAWSTPQTLITNATRPTVLYDGLNYHIWYVSDNTIKHRSGNTPDSSENATVDQCTISKGNSNENADNKKNIETNNFGDCPFVMKEDSTYYMFIATPDGDAIKIYRSADGVAWNESENNVVFKKSETPGAWDEAKIDIPRVIKDENGYKLYYQGYQVTSDSSARKYQIGVATSTTIDGEYKRVRQNPIIEPSLSKEGWDSYRVFQPWVVKDENSYYMWYAGNNEEYSGGPAAIGLAYSVDGVNWTKSSNNPVIQSTGTTQGGPSVVKVNGDWHMWYLCGNNINYVSDIAK